MFTDDINPLLTTGNGRHQVSEQLDKDNAGELCTDSGKQEIVTDPSFSPRYPEDYRFAQLLASGDGKAWQAFDREYRPKVSLYVKQRYPNQFSDIEIEEICDNVQERLMANNYRALRIYRGECPFWRYLVMAVEWEAKNRLRKRFVPPPAEGSETYDSFEDPPEGPVPAILSEVLSDELRWAFLLRYYYDFGFPPEEIRLLAKKRGLPIKEITKRIVRAFEGFLFSVGLEHQNVLNNSILSDDLRQKFQNNDFKISQNVIVEVKEANRQWTIRDKDSKQAYLVKKENDALSIYFEEDPLWQKYKYSVPHCQDRN